MVTVIVAVALTVVGLALVFYQPQAIDLLQSVGLPADIQRQLAAWMADRSIAWAALAASPTLLVVGSLVPGL
jgi:hypothetical protein